MKPFHSTLLKPMPTAAKPKRSRIPRRLLLIILISAFIVIPAFIIITRALPPDGAGFVFYWVHDHIFLPIKGYTYTLFYPYSLSWWGPVLTALALWLIAYLAMVSFIKDPHVSILRKVIRRSPKKRHGVLVKTSRWLKKWKMEPLLLKEVANMERKKCLEQLIHQPLSSTDETGIKRLFDLTYLYVDLMTLPPVKEPKETHLQILGYWQHVLLQSQARLGQNPQNEFFNRLTAQIAKQCEPLILTLLDNREEDELKEVLEAPAGFDMVSITVDMMHLVALYNNNPAMLFPVKAAASAETVKKAVLTRLAVSVNKRRSILEEIRSRLEKLQKQRTGPLATSDSEPFEPILKGLVAIDLTENPNKTAFFLSTLGELVLLLAMQLSVLVGDVSIALGYMDTLETLDFVFNCLDTQETENPKSPYFTGLKALNRLPEPGYYRLCAELAQIELDKHENLWKESILKEEGIIRPGDFQLARSRIESLNHISGPDKAQGTY